MKRIRKFTYTVELTTEESKIKPHASDIIKFIKSKRPDWIVSANLEKFEYLEK